MFNVVSPDTVVRKILQGARSWLQIDDVPRVMGASYWFLLQDEVITRRQKAIQLEWVENRNTILIWLVAYRTQVNASNLSCCRYLTSLYIGGR